MNTQTGVIWCACLTASLAGQSTAAAEKPKQKPNILLIITDQHRFDCIGAMGNKVIKTPYIDALARDGVMFSNAYSSTPSSTPARAALLTGMSPWVNGLLGYGKVAKSYPYEMPQMLRDNDYYTYAIGKLHYAPQRNLHGYHEALLDESGRVDTPDFVSDYRKWFAEKAPGINPDSTGIGWNEHNGKVYSLDESLHPTTWTADQASSMIKEYDRKNPLFLTVSFARPHSPYDPPQRVYDQYRDAKISAPYIGDWCGRFANYPNVKNAAFGDFGVQHAIESRSYYYAAVTFIDEKIGQIIDELKRKGIYDNTLIVFTSDHGDMLGDHYHWRKTYAYEGSTHVPFIVKFPRNIKGTYSKGSTMKQVVELRDVLPTFLDVAEIAIPEQIDGKSILPLYTNKKAPWREYIDMEHTASYDPKGYWAALTDGEQKYIYFFPTGSEQLFDISRNKGELHDLASDPQYADRLKKWRNRMVDHLKVRGTQFVKNGELQIIKKGILYSPNYPKK